MGFSRCLSQHESDARAQALAVCPIVESDVGRVREVLSAAYCDSEPCDATHAQHEHGVKRVEMATRRSSIPRALVDTVLYKSARACCVCRARGSGVQVHHIDGNPLNNAEDNLAALCPNCHGEAHTTRKLTRTLDAQSVRDAKARWEAEVQRQDLCRISTADVGLLNMRLWTYFNFSLLLELAQGKNLDLSWLSPVPDAKYDGLIDAYGFPVPGGNGASSRTLFESHPQSDARRIQQVFSAVTEWLIRVAPPIDLSRVWARTQLRNLAAQNAIVFMNRGLYFSRTGQNARGEERIARYTKARIRIQFQIDTWSVYSTSALTLHFTGHNRVASLLLLRSAETNTVDGKTMLLVNATPLALGTGFPPDDHRTPAIAYRDALDDDACV